MSESFPGGCELERLPFDEVSWQVSPESIVEEREERGGPDEIERPSRHRALAHEKRAGQVDKQVGEEERPDRTAHECNAAKSERRRHPAKVCGFGAGEEPDGEKEAYRNSSPG